MSKAACKAGLPRPDQHKVGHAEFIQTSFETIERGSRDQLGRMFGGGGFDPAADILGITVNRWPHGYAYQYSSLADAFWVDGGEQPCVTAAAAIWADCDRECGCGGVFVYGCGD